MPIELRAVCEFVHSYILYLNTYKTLSRLKIKSGNCVRVHPNTFSQHMKVLKQVICMYYGCVMQIGDVYILNNDITMSF